MINDAKYTLLYNKQLCLLNPMINVIGWGVGDFQLKYGRLMVRIPQIACKLLLVRAVCTGKGLDLTGSWGLQGASWVST